MNPLPKTIVCALEGGPEPYLVIQFSLDNLKKAGEYIQFLISELKEPLKIFLEGLPELQLKRPTIEFGEITTLAFPPIEGPHSKNSIINSPAYQAYCDILALEEMLWGNAGALEESQIELLLSMREAALDTADLESLLSLFNPNPYQQYLDFLKEIFN